jgi:hypothetical protein
MLVLLFIFFNNNVAVFEQEAHFTSHPRIATFFIGFDSFFSFISRGKCDKSKVKQRQELHWACLEWVKSQDSRVEEGVNSC